MKQWVVLHEFIHLAHDDGQELKAHKSNFLGIMVQGSICQYNKFGFCKFGNNCYRKHENKLCENKTVKLNTAPSDILGSAGFT